MPTFASPHNWQASSSSATCTIATSASASTRIRCSGDCSASHRSRSRTCPRDDATPSQKTRPSRFTPITVTSFAGGSRTAEEDSGSATSMSRSRFLSIVVTRKKMSSRKTQSINGDIATPGVSGRVRFNRMAIVQSCL